jgi:hypothetical protein
VSKFNEFLLGLEPIKREIIGRLYGLNEPTAETASSNKFNSQNTSSQETSLLKKTSPKATSSSYNIFESRDFTHEDAPSYEDLAEELSSSKYPEEVFRYASGYSQNSLKLTEEDIIQLEQDALRELARGNRPRKR